MTPLIHRLYIFTMVAIVLSVTYYLAIAGMTYYSLPLEERFYHEQYEWFKPSGIMGQGLGVIGTFLIFFGVTIYILRKRYGLLEKYIRLKYLLEFHIFLCTLGPIMILFHTTFKFGGIVSVAFWSMVAVVLSGVVGRFIYIQIPRSIEGRALSQKEVEEQISALINQIQTTQGAEDLMVKHEDGILDIATVKNKIHNSSLSPTIKSQVVTKLKEMDSLRGKLARLDKMKRLFEYWHVVHMPFAIIMLVIVIIHIVVTISLGYKWIF